MEVYVIERVRTHKGQPKEREERRKGHRVVIENLKLGSPLVIRYIEDNDAVLQTSKVEAYNSDWKKSAHLTVQTKNSVYCFRKESAK